MSTLHPLIRQVGDPILRTQAKPITSFDARLAAQVERMFLVMAEADGAGLAANQIGQGNALFVYDCDGARGAVANPRITVLDETGMTDPEGCLSVFGQSYPTTRASVVRLDGFDPDGEPVRIEATGYLARCFQHETDHLLGKLYVDRLPRELRRLALQRSTELPV